MNDIKFCKILDLFINEFHGFFTKSSNLSLSLEELSKMNQIKHLLEKFEFLNSVYTKSSTKKK